jgi:cysteine desulfurase / selenocysteine lyase
MNDLNQLIGSEEAFPILRKWDFFNHAGVAPLTAAAAGAMRQFVAEAEAGAYLGTSWYKDVEKLRGSAAAMLNASPQEVAFLKNTSEGLATVALGIDWQAGDRIVTTNVEYPANIYPWMEAARRWGLEVAQVPEEAGADGTRRVPLERILEEASHPRTRLVTLSHVEFASGQRHDLAAIGGFCRERGVLFCVDAIQSLGVLPVDVQAMKIDYLSADGHKWLLGPEGAAVFYCRRELIERTRPLVVGWMNVVNAEQFGQYDYTLKPDARRHESGSHNIAGLAGLRASLELLHGLGSEQVSQRIKLLTDRLIDGLQSAGWTLASPREGDCWSGIVSFTAPGRDLPALARELRERQHTEIAVREGRLRCSPHFYNTEEQIDRLVDRLAAIIQG